MALILNPLVLPITPPEIVYVSPPYSAVSGAPASRSRRSNRSSSDGPVASWDGFLEEDLRAGGPSLPDLPCDSFPLPYNHPFRVQRGHEAISQFIRGTAQICWDNGVNLREVDFYERRSVYNKTDQRTFTCLISATKTSLNEKWIDTARKVRQFLHQRGVNNICVEILDPRLSQRIKLSSCTQRDPIFGLWQEVCGQILRTIPLKGINIISCFRIGGESGTADSVPTVVLGVDHNEDRDWKVTREDILKILLQHGLNMVGLLIRKDSLRTHMERYSGPGLDRLTGDNAANIGQSLSPHRMTSSRGTLGGYIQLRNPDKGHWVAFALTCCHCVLPTGKNLLTQEKQYVDKWKTSGVKVADKDADTSLLVDSPSQHELSSGIDELKRQIEEHENNETYKAVEAAKKVDDFIIPRDGKKWQIATKAIRILSERRHQLKSLYSQKEYVLGSVFAASGLVEKPLATVVERNWPASQSIVNWALIKIPKRTVGSNSSPDLHLIGTEKLTSLAEKDSIKPEEVLMKLGHATGHTTGTYNGMMETHIARDHKTGHEIITQEHSILNTNCTKSFIEHGDSGSFVYDRIGEVQGICFGGNDQGDIAYFSHIVDVIADIKAVVKGVAEIRLLGAEF